VLLTRIDAYRKGKEQEEEERGEDEGTERKESGDKEKNKRDKVSANLLYIKIMAARDQPSQIIIRQKRCA
jgi:hypothetical protein